MAAFLSFPRIQALHARGGIVSKTRQETKQQFEILTSGTFYGFTDDWTEYLCLAHNPDGSITLSSRKRKILAEAARYR